VLDRALIAIGHVLEQDLQEPLGRGELTLDACYDETRLTLVLRHAPVGPTLVVADGRHWVPRRALIFSVPGADAATVQRAAGQTRLRLEFET
jgi:hypothetical protein